MDNVLKHGAIAFLIISFTKLNEIYYLDAKHVIHFYYSEERKSIPYSFIKEKGHLIKQGYLTRINYLKIIDDYYS